MFFSSTGTMAAYAYTRNNGSQNYFDYQGELTNLTRTLKVQADPTNCCEAKRVWQALNSSTAGRMSSHGEV